MAFFTLCLAPAVCAHSRLQALGPGAAPPGKTLPPVKLPTPRMFRSKTRSKPAQDVASIPEQKASTSTAPPKPIKEGGKKKTVRALANANRVAALWQGCHTHQIATGAAPTNTTASFLAAGEGVYSKPSRRREGRDQEPAAGLSASQDIGGAHAHLRRQHQSQVADCRPPAVLLCPFGAPALFLLYETAWLAASCCGAAHRGLDAPARLVVARAPLTLDASPFAGHPRDCRRHLGLGPR